MDRLPEHGIALTVNKRKGTREEMANGPILTWVGPDKAIVTFVECESDEVLDERGVNGNAAESEIRSLRRQMQSNPLCFPRFRIHYWVRSLRRWARVLTPGN